MGKKYASLECLLSDDRHAKRYFNKLPEYVQESVHERGTNINSFESLRDYVDNLTQGDR